MKSDLSPEQIVAIKKILDDAIEKGPWDASSFLRVIGKNLKEIRDRFLLEVKHDDISNQDHPAHLAHRIAMRSGQKEVYIALYVSEGDDIQNWERLLYNLPRHVTARPIYSEEKEVKKLLSAKDNPVNEGYAVVFINKSDILELPEERVSRDRYGIKLLTLKDNSVSAKNIIRFVHKTGTYRYLRGHLVLQSQ